MLNLRLILAPSFVLLLLTLMLFQPSVTTQQPETREQRAARFRQMSTAAENKGLAESFTGISANGRIETGLFAIRSSGVSTEPVLKAAEVFLSALTESQRATTVFGVDDVEWRKWMNQDYYVRKGVSFLDMTNAQRETAFELLRASLSAKGLKQTRDIMRLNHTLGELTDNDFDRYGEWRYHVTIMGTPSRDEPWGWQLDGHHAIVNYFVLGDQVVMRPFFAGSEPVIATSGIYKGTTVLQDEQSRGLRMVTSLNDSQRQRAILRLSKTGNDNVTEAWKDNAVLDYAGLPASEMSPEQRTQLRDLIAIYVANMDEGHARIKMDEVTRYLDRTSFAWIGGTDSGGVFYYRIHSPVLLIEFDHQLPANLRQYAKDPTVPNRQHIHVVVRTPNGNDYGKDLLRQHYQQHPHPQP